MGLLRRFEIDRPTREISCFFTTLERGFWLALARSEDR